LKERYRKYWWRWRRLEPPAWQLKLAGKGLAELEIALGLLELDPRKS